MEYFLTTRMDDRRDLHIDALTKLKALWPKEDLTRGRFNKDCMIIGDRISVSKSPLVSSSKSISDLS